ncbi:LysE family translocator [Actinokineospora pegani]|uniref:LysE family translocator n=1 Tax=Actinokineospora pegani TaxID=2654637 RepID=UPI0012EAAD4E|nr:LysE family translocator [Actinokineospora pegani]
MPDLTTIWVFLAASLVLLLVPGPSVLYVSSRTLDLGARGGAMSTLGLAAGDTVQVLAATVGLSALVAANEVAFEVVKYAGAAYLVWLGVRRLMTPIMPLESEQGQVAQASGGRIFLDGLVVNALNPKSTLFFLAFLPAFVNSDQAPVWSTTLVLGLVFVVVGVLTNGAWAALSLLLRSRAQRSRGFLQAQRYVGGGVLIALAGVAVFTGTQ